MLCRPQKLRQLRQLGIQAGLVAALLLSIWVPIVTAAEPPPAASPVVASNSQATAKQIEQWITQLNDDRFEIRQQAQQLLQQVGPPALETIAKTARTGSLESSTRAINILLQWAESKQQDQQAFRLTALQALVNLPNHPREAAMATRVLAEAREKQALQSIHRLGGKVNQSGQSFLHIVIDKDWKGGDEGLKHLAAVQHAYAISLRVAPITEEGLKHLATASQVPTLEIHGTDVSPAALEKLQQQLPKTLIDFRDGPMLGILGSAAELNQESVAVTDVVKDGPAFKAGIVPGDRISQLNGEKLSDFKALTEGIKKHQPGETVTLTVLRKGKPQQISVTFERWGATDNTKLVRQKNAIRRLPIPQQWLPAQNVPNQVPRR